MYATYSAEDNKLRIYANGKLSPDTLAEVKSHGFKWAPKQELFVAPAWSPDREDFLLDLCGEIDDDDYSPEERAADRAERFEDYRDKRRNEAGGYADTFEAGPSVFGHQNLARAQRQAARHDRTRGRALTQWDKAEYWQERTAGVISHALHKSSAKVRRGRILRLEAEQRKLLKNIAEAIERRKLWVLVVVSAGADSPIVPSGESGHIGFDGEKTTAAGKLAYTLANCGCWGDYRHPRTNEKRSLYSMLTETQDPITPREAATLWLAARTIDPQDPESNSQRWARHYENRLAYERAMLANEGGRASDCDIVPGGFLGAYQVTKVNRSNADGRVVSVDALKDGRECCYKVDRLPEGAYREPTPEELAAFATMQAARKAAAKATKTKEPPLINPTDEDAERLQAIWNDRYKAMGRNRLDFTPTEVRRMTQAEYSARSKVGYSSYETAEISEQLRIRRESPMGRDMAGRVTVFKIRKGPSAGGIDSPNAVVVLTDKPRKPIPWGAVTAIADQQPSAEQLAPRIAEIYKALSQSWLPSDDTDESKLINDAVYLGWAYVASMSQFGLTEEGWKIYRAANPISEGVTA